MGSLKLGCKFFWPFFYREPSELTSINRRKSATNPEIASINVCQRPIFCDFPSVFCGNPHCRPSNWLPKKGAFRHNTRLKKGPGKLTPNKTIRENQAIHANLRIDSRESGRLRPFLLKSSRIILPWAQRMVAIRGAQPSARLSEEICLSEGSLRGSLRGFCGDSPLLL